MTNVIKFPSRERDDTPERVFMLLDEAAGVFVRHHMRKHPGVDGFEMEAILEGLRADFLANADGAFGNEVVSGPLVEDE